MIEIEFGSEEIEQLRYERRYHPHPRVRQRMEAVYLKALGYQHQEIGRIVGIGQTALRRYLRMYQAGGIEALKELNFYRPKSELTGIRRSPTQVGKFLKGLGVKRLASSLWPR